MYTPPANEEFAISPKLNNLVMSKLWLWMLWLACFVVLFAWRTQNLDAFGLSNDEGAHLMWAQLAVDGYPLYSQTQAVQAPLFIESIGWAFRLGGSTIQAGRWVTLLGFALLTIVLSWLAYRAGRELAALVTLLLVGLSPLAFEFSRLVMAEIPATALAVLSLALVILFLQGEHRVWLVASGLALGLSFVAKSLNPFVVAPIGLLLWLHRSPPFDTLGRRIMSLDKNWRGLLLDGFGWSVGFGLPFVAVVFLYQPAAMYDQLILFRGDLRAAIPGSWPQTFTHFEQFIDRHWSLWLLAIFGIISALLKSYLLRPADRPKSNQATLSVPYNLIWLVWLAAGVAMLLWHTPLFPHHFIVLLPPLILLATTAISNLVIFWSNRANQASRWAAIGLAVIVGVATFNLPAMVKANQQTAAIVTGGREQDALKLLNAVSQPSDFLMGDSQLLIFMTDRRTPPPLGDVAWGAIQAERQTSARMIDLTESYQSPAVVQWSLRLPWLPEYLDWVQDNYLVQRVWDNDHIIYFGRRLPPDEPIPNEQTIRLGDSISLRGYQINSSNIAAGQPLTVKAYWQTDRPLTENYTIFTQLLDSNGTLVVGQDSQPLSGYWPTQDWPPGEIITDMIQLSLPPELPSGQYRLVTGMYLLATLERLSVLQENQDYIKLTTIKIE